MFWPWNIPKMLPVLKVWVMRKNPFCRDRTGRVTGTRAPGTWRNWSRKKTRTAKLNQDEVPVDWQARGGQFAGFLLPGCAGASGHAFLLELLDEEAGNLRDQPSFVSVPEVIHALKNLAFRLPVEGFQFGVQALGIHDTVAVSGDNKGRAACGS